MRSLVFSLLIIIVSIFIPNNLNNDIISAIEKGDVKKLVNYFDKTIELSLYETNGFYSKEQAQIILEDFFETNKPSAIKLIQSSENINTQKFVLLMESIEGNKFYLFYEISVINWKVNTFKITKI